MSGGLNQVVKFPSEQSQFDTSGSKNNIDFVLPGGAVYDLSRSYIAVTVDARSSTAAGVEFLTKNFLNMGASMDGVAADSVTTVHLPTAAAIVKNCHMSSQNFGKISDIRRVDKYAFTKSLYSKTFEDDRNDVGAFNPRVVENSDIAGNMNEYNTYGTELSRYKTHDVRIPLKDLMPYCRSIHDGNKHGSTRLHTEINFDQFGNSTVAITGAIHAPRTSSTEENDLRGIRDLNAFLAITVNTATPDLQRTLITLARYGSTVGQPFFVGQQLTITANYTPPGAAAEAVLGTTRTIVEIKQNADDSLSLVLDADIPTTTALATGGVIAAGTVADLVVDVAKGTLNITNVELVTELVQEPAPKGPVTYDTVLSEEDTYPALNSMTRNYSIPPMCKNFYVMFFKSNGVVSDDQHLESYRVTIDNVEQSQSTVNLGSPEHFDNVMRTYANGGGELYNLTEKYFTCAAHAEADIKGRRGNMICYPTQFLNREQKMTLQLQASAGQNLTGRVILYYDVVRSV